MSRRFVNWPVRARGEREEGGVEGRAEIKAGLPVASRKCKAEIGVVEWCAVR